MSTTITRYRSFLLRIWRVGDPRHTQWRASLEDTRTRTVTRFTNREALLAFLRQWDPDEGAPVESQDDAESVHTQPSPQTCIQATQATQATQAQTKEEL